MDTKDMAAPSVEPETNAERDVRHANERMERNKEECLLEIQSIFKDGPLDSAQVVETVAARIKQYEAVCAMQMPLLGRPDEDWRLVFPHWIIQDREWVGYVSKKEREQAATRKLNVDRSAAKKNMTRRRGDTLVKVRAVYRNFNNQESDILLDRIDVLLDKYDQYCKEQAAKVGIDCWQEFHPPAVIEEKDWREFVKPNNRLEMSGITVAAMNDQAKKPAPQVKRCYHCGGPDNNSHDDRNCPKYMRSGDQRLIDWGLGWDLHRTGTHPDDLRLSDSNRRYIKMGYDARARDQA